ncbi:hypothetical protein [Desulforhopalus singaporensis]|uniref:Uncharacterized protein n=1 Tax=Desulforhopalus singaporensis TaxID=91360 RepID=A0A1H0UB51_9BACT|nr:hypothetical protein [Desulforhopalus singaporensis]SDP63532.1 hypothetical protein SAMN05660330_03478 [Desulforhopalus singaporensis]
MQSQTYRDIIDEKIEEWQKGLKKIEEIAVRAPSTDRTDLIAQKDKLKAAIEAATAQLRELDEQETVQNTIETKDKILKIFSAIDRDLSKYDDSTPFML